MPEDDDARSGWQAVDVGAAAHFRVSFVPTRRDLRFGTFQIHVDGITLGDATTTGAYAHLQDLRRLSSVVERPGVRAAEPLILGDTFDHLDLSWEVNDADVVFVFATQPQWGSPPPSAPVAGETMRAAVARTVFVEVCREFDRQVVRLLDQG